MGRMALDGGPCGVSLKVASSEFTGWMQRVRLSLSSSRMARKGCASQQAEICHKLGSHSSQSSTLWATSRQPPCWKLTELRPSVSRLAALRGEAYDFQDWTGRVAGFKSFTKRGHSAQPLDSLDFFRC